MDQIKAEDVLLAKLHLQQATVDVNQEDRKVFWTSVGTPGGLNVEGR